MAWSKANIMVEVEVEEIFSVQGSKEAETEKEEQEPGTGCIQPGGELPDFALPFRHDVSPL